jgi:hypothetical protein
MYHLLFASCLPKDAEGQDNKTEKSSVTFNFTKTGLVQTLTEEAQKRAEEKQKEAEK